METDGPSCVSIKLYRDDFVVIESLSPIRLFATPWTIVRQAPLSMGFSRQQYWSGLPCPSLADLPDPGIELTSPALTGGFFTTEPPRKTLYGDTCIYIADSHSSTGETQHCKQLYSSLKKKKKL